MNGCSRFFKHVKPAMPVYLIDPPGSGLYSYIMNVDQAVAKQHAWLIPMSAERCFILVGRLEHY